MGGRVESQVSPASFERGHRGVLIAGLLMLVSNRSQDATAQHHRQDQRPQAELIPAAFGLVAHGWLRRLGFIWHSPRSAESRANSSVGNFPFHVRSYPSTPRVSKIRVV